MEPPRFEPAVLKWAREGRFGPRVETLEAHWAASWTELSPSIIVEWEKGIGQPTFSQIRKLAEIYKRPLAVFFLTSPPEEINNPPDLRTIGSEDNDVLSPEALLVIRKARRIQEVAATLLEELGEKPHFKYPRHTVNENASELAKQIRTDLNISLKEQTAFRTFEDFFEYLRVKIEGSGVITLKTGLQDSFSTADCRALSFADQLPYVILVNNKDSEGAKNFSLVHEFAHLLLRQAGICNNYKSFGAGRGINPVEVFCNQFAASFLVPGNMLLSHSELRDDKSLSNEQIDITAERLALEFKVSRVVILRRLLTLGRIQKPTYDSKTKEWSDENIAPRRPGGRFSLSTALKKNGVAFSSLVLEAYKNRKISYAGVSDYLGLKTKHLPTFEKLVNSYATG
jgi:Zn-dependent peptidase ImmA (M78 family)